MIPSRRSRGSHAPERSVAVFFLATSAHPGFSLCDSYTLSNIPVQILYSFSEQRKAHQRRYIDDYIENRIVNMFGTGIAIVQARVTNKTPFRRTSMSLNKASIAVALAAFLAVGGDCRAGAGSAPRRSRRPLETAEVVSGLHLPGAHAGKESAVRCHHEGIRRQDRAAAGQARGQVH